MQNPEFFDIDSKYDENANNGNGKLDFCLQKKCLFISF